MLFKNDGLDIVLIADIFFKSFLEESMFISMVTTVCCCQGGYLNCLIY